MSPTTSKTSANLTDAVVAPSRKGHAARLASSRRLQAVLEALHDAGAAGLTTRELFAQTGSMAVHSDVSELRANGYEVSCALDRSSSDRRVYRYRLGVLA